jgi:Arc/MetJ family transcription regulator
VTKTLIDLDDEVLPKAQAALGTLTKKETVNVSLREAVRQGAIREYLQRTETCERRLVLVDASALVHCAEPMVVARLIPFLVLDVLATCAGVKHELATTDAGPVLAALRRVPLRWLPTDDADLAMASEIQAELTESSLPWSRLVVAAVASRHSVTVLHYSTDFDMVAKVTGQATEWVAVPGTLPERPSGRAAR